MDRSDLMLQDSYIRLAAACPEVDVTNVRKNFCTISNLLTEADEQGTALVVFPELSLTGYSLGDLVMNEALLAAAQTGLCELAEQTDDIQTAAVVGLPMQIGNALYNCAAVIADGEIKGIVPKKHLPAYGEFYEKRWYQTWGDRASTTIKIGERDVPFGNNLIFDIGGAPVGVEICEDLWSEDPPSRSLSENGALIIANPSASPELVGKAAYRRQLVGQQSARLILGYVYAGCDSSESTMDTVMGGHQLIAENGQVLAERKPFAANQRLTFADVDLEHLRYDRRRNSNTVNQLGAVVVKTIPVRPEFTPRPRVSKHPFLPEREDIAQRNERLQTVIDIQAQGLARRIKTLRTKRIHLGLSGGLDSTHALLVACHAARLLDMSQADLIRTYTMPGDASSIRTQSNATELAASLRIPNEVIPINELTRAGLQAIDHDSTVQDIAYENAQARIRTSLLFNKANQVGGLVLGTGDLSEIALGWATYNGDHMSHYHVNAGVPKTLLRSLVEYFADHHTDNPRTRVLLKDILDTPVSPELVSGDGDIAQKTEDLIGPYELHDFFLYHLVRWGESPKKIEFLANQAFGTDHSPAEIDNWLNVFMSRFARNQFKRSAMPDGPKVGSVALSPRGDWRMPSDLLTLALDY